MFTGQRLLKLVLVGLLAFIGAFSLPPVPPAQAAAALVVTGLGDSIAADGVCTLREAITAANTNAPAGDCPAGTSGADMISFSVTGTITLTSQLPDIRESLMISGPGADRLTISGNHAVGVLHVVAGSVMLDDLTVA